MRLWSKLLIVVALLGAAVFLVEHKKQQRLASTSGEAVAEAPLQTSLPRLLDLGAGKCVPCKMMTPILDEMKETYAGKLDVVFIDVWENQQAGAQYGVRVIPTQIFYDAEGKELFRHEGFMSKEDILAKWQELGINFSNE
jgi:thioredoxin 1